MAKELNGNLVEGNQMKTVNKKQLVRMLQDEAAAEETTTEEVAAEETTTEEAAAEETTTEEAAAEGTTTDEAAAEGTTTEEATAEGTTTEEAAAVETTTEEAVTEETTDKPTEEAPPEENTDEPTKGAAEDNASDSACDCLGSEENGLPPQSFFVEKGFTELYGSSCSAWDKSYDYCLEGGANFGEEWCTKDWCYVSSKCESGKSTLTFADTEYADTLKWSMDTCSANVKSGMIRTSMKMEGDFQTFAQGKFK